MRASSEKGNPSPLRLMLLPFSWLYSLAVVIRNWAFDRQVLRSTAVGAPVISVGNITVGGTGKTPLVEYIARYCLERGKRVAIVSRGYRRDSKGIMIVSDGRTLRTNARVGGDEPVQMARKFLQACVVVGERRVEAAQVAVNSLQAEVIILDDGFQHRYLRRDLDIVVVRAAQDGTKGHMLPAGMYREPLSALRRARLVAFSNARNAESIERLKSSLAPWYTGPLVMYGHKLADVRRLPDHASIPQNTLKGKSIVAFSGIGHHEDFVEMLKALGCDVSRDVRFPDHHQYVASDIQGIVGEMKESSADMCVTTEKDAMRLIADQLIMARFLNSYPFSYITIEVEILGGKDVLHTMIDECLKKAA